MVENVDPDVRKRYNDKLRYIGNLDPYTYDEQLFSIDKRQFPKVSYIDIVNYLVYSKSAYSDKELKAYKSLDSYKLFLSGWVRNVSTFMYDRNVLVFGKVMHSQRINEKPLRPWFIAKEDGEILCAHCTCVAGLGEACSHVAALMFLVDDSVRNLETVSVTDKKAYWVVPPKKIVTMERCENINYRTPSYKENEQSENNICTATFPELSEHEYEQFLQQVCNTGVKSAVLLVTKPFCEHIENEQEYRGTFCNLYKTKHKNKSLNDLIKIAAHLNVYIDIDLCKTIEEKTRKQNLSKLWFTYRSGRITASTFKSACRMRPTKPALSTIKKICYPQSMKFHSNATAYGCKHEKHAVNEYYNIINALHINLKMSHCGLIVNPIFPMFGASPDSFVECDCCGKGVVEVKCPICAKDSTISEFVNKKKTYLLKKNKCNDVMLDNNHQYFYQVQMQMALSNRSYCDFVVWTSKEVYIERIKFNESFWDSESRKARELWYNMILPELLGTYFTKSCVVPSSDQA